jgi:hypothetical protein
MPSRRPLVRAIRVLCVAVALVIPGSGRLHGQSAAYSPRVIELLRPATTGPAAADSIGWQAWGSLGLLSASVRAPEYSRRGSGGHLSMWATYDRFAVSVRSAGFPVYSDGTAGMGEEAILAGLHLPFRILKSRDLDLVVAAGGGRSFGTGYLVPAKSEGMFAASGQLNFNYHLIGVGVDAMADVGPSRRFVGTGVSVSLGWFR